MWVELDHPKPALGYQRRHAVKLSARPRVIKRSPMLGEHTDEILKEVLGMTNPKSPASGRRCILDPPKKAA